MCAVNPIQNLRPLAKPRTFIHGEYKGYNKDIERAESPLLSWEVNEPFTIAGARLIGAPTIEAENA
jgi:hypothetical protein